MVQVPEYKDKIASFSVMLRYMKNSDGFTKPIYNI